ncbi:hypothetical protein [Pontimicrobium sp. MEBiC01747]
MVRLCTSEYISKDKKVELEDKSIEAGKLLNYMINNPDKFGVKKDDIVSSMQ